MVAVALAAVVLATLTAAQDIYSVDDSTSRLQVPALPEDDGVFGAEDVVDDDISMADTTAYYMISDPHHLKNERELQHLIEDLGPEVINEHETRFLISPFHNVKSVEELEGYESDYDGAVNLGDDTEDFDDNITGEEDLENNADLDNISIEDDLEDTEEFDDDLIRQLVSDINFESDCGEECEDNSDDDAIIYPAIGEESIPKREKRSPAPRRSSSRSGSSSRSRSGGWLGGRRSSSSSSSGSSSRSSGGWFGRRSSSSSSRGSSSSSSRSSSSRSGSGSSSGSTGGSSSSSSSNPSYGWNTGTSGSSRGTGSSTSGTAVATGAGVATGTGVIAGTTSGSGSATKPSGGYPTQPGSGSPTGTQPVAGYPSGTRPAGGYPTGTQPVAGYPSGTAAGGSPTGTQPVAGYPSGTPAGGYPTGTQPVAGYPSGTRPAGGYPTGTQPVAGYPTGTQPVAGYPSGTRPAGGYPTGTQPVAGYPTGTQPVAGYPSGTRPAGGYPTGTQPVAGYPTGTQPVAGYPSGTRPAGGYPTGTQPVAGYPSGTRPFGGYPTGTQPVPGYPTASRPFGSYPSGNQPYGGYPTGSQPYGGYPTFSQPRQSYPVAYQPYGGFPTATRPGGYPTAGITSGRFAAGGFGGYPVGGYPMPKKKKSKKDKVKEVIDKAVTGYVLHKARKKNKFVSPSHLSGFGHSHSRYGSRLGMAGLGGLALAKTGKKIIGAYVKIQIAKYALKFGAEAAKAYFRYKLGLELDEYQIGKFVHRYHQHRVRGDNRWRYYRHHNRHHRNRQNGRVENEAFSDNITLGEFCRRPCVEGDTRICQFNFDVHLYQTLSRACYDCPRNTSDCERPQCVAADGVRRMVTAVNKAIPGPAIQVCVGDKVLVDVMNHLPSTSLTLHWHGLTMGASRAMPTARPTPYMDGAPGITQCPIPPGSGFRYAFFASEPGTHFWHAHTGVERGDGVFGPLIVHQPTSADPTQFLAEHLLTVNDWFHKSSQSLYAQRHSTGQALKPSALLINGMGPQQHEEAGGSASPRVPYAKFLVQKGTRYRLRIINAATTNCPVTVTIDNHDLILLAVDGASVSPVNSSAVLVSPGERYDAMFSAEQESATEGETYWMRVTGGGDCASLTQYAALQYLPSDFNVTLPAAPSAPSSMTNPSPGADEFSGRCSSPGQRCVSGLRSPLSLPERLQQPRMNVTFYLAFSSKYIHNRNLYSLLYYDISQDSEEERVATPQINNLSFRPPPKPLLVDRRPLKSANCSSEGVRQIQCSADYCECIHALNIALGTRLDLVLIGEGPANGTAHPVHLHGHKFWVLSQVGAAEVPDTATNNATLPEGATLNATLPEGATGAEGGENGSEFLSRRKVMQLDSEGKLVRNLESPVMKDSVTIPPGGYTILRLAAENPGVWLLESQVLFDAQAGMALVMQVGTSEDVPKSPPPDFPTC